MAKAITLKDKDGNELYPVTSWDLVNQGSSGGDWHCVASAVLSSAGTNLICSIPTYYDCYQIIGACEFDSGVSNTWCDLRLLNGSAQIGSTLIREYRNDQTLTVSTFNDRGWQINMEGCNAWDGININLNAYYNRPGSNFLKFQGEMTLCGSGWKISRTSGRFQSSTKFDTVQLTAGGNMQNGGFIKVFACNKSS